MYMSQKKKAKISPKVKEVLKKYNLKGSISVKYQSAIILTIDSGEIDFLRNYFDHNCDRVGVSGSSYETFCVVNKSLNVNPYWYAESFTGEAVEALHDLHEALKGDDYFEYSDFSSDDFRCSHYIEVKIGTWKKPYEVTGKKVSESD